MTVEEKLSNLLCNSHALRIIRFRMEQDEFYGGRVSQKEKEQTKRMARVGCKTSE